MAANRGKVPNVIKLFRDVYSYTQAELAEEMKPEFPWVDKALISKIESGKCDPTEEMIEWCCNRANELSAEPERLDWEIYQEDGFVSVGPYLEPLEQTILEYLENTDIDHRLTRSHLWSLFGSDRMNRRAIENLRSYGYRIGSGLGAEGYWLIKSEEEYKRFIKEYSSRAYKVLKNKAAMDRYTEGQIRI